jgi:hypothetical protein
MGWATPTPAPHHKGEGDKEALWNPSLCGEGQGWGRLALNYPKLFGAAVAGENYAAEKSYSPSFSKACHFFKKFCPPPPNLPHNPPSLFEPEGRAQPVIPRISVPGLFDPVFPVQKRIPCKHDPISTAALLARIEALKSALANLPREARRLARWKARGELAR